MLAQETFQECEIQVDRLLRLAFEAGDEVEPWEKARHSVFAPIATDGVHHPARFEGPARIDVEVVRFSDAWIRRLEAEGEAGARRGEGQEVPHCRHGLLGMRDHHRRIAVVRVQDLQVRRRRSNSFQELANRGHIDLRGRRGSQTERLKAEEVRLASEAEIHRSEVRETPHLSADASSRSELRLSTHRLHAPRADLAYI